MATEQTEARNDASKKSQQIAGQWKAISMKYPDAINDLLEYIDAQREMYRKYAEDRAMPHPNPSVGELVPIDNETVAALLQNSRGLSIVKTYLEVRIDNQVAPGTKTK